MPPATLKIVAGAESAPLEEAYLKELCAWLAATPAPTDRGAAVDHAAALKALVDVATAQLERIKARLREEAKGPDKSVEFRGKRAAAVIVFPEASLKAIDLMVWQRVSEPATRLYARSTVYQPVDQWRLQYDALDARTRRMLLREPIWTVPTPQVSFKV